MTWLWPLAGHHAGILIVRFDNDPRHNLTDRGIATAISKLESSGVPIADRIHVLNQWRCVILPGTPPKSYCSLESRRSIGNLATISIGRAAPVELSEPHPAGAHRFLADLKPRK